MFRSRIFITHASQFSLGVADGLMTLHNSVDGSFAFSMQRGNVLSRGIDFFAESVGFRLAFRMLGGRTFTFTRQAFCLNTKTLERPLKLACNFAQALCNGSVLEQIGPGGFNLCFGLSGHGKLLSIRFFRCSQTGCTLLGFAPKSLVIFLESFAFGFDKNQPSGEGIDFRGDFVLSFLEGNHLLFLISAFTRLAVAT